MPMNLDALRAARAPREPKPFPIPTRELCQRYERLFTGAVNDVLRERCLLDQALPHRIKPLRDEMAVAGIAFTIKGSKNLDMEDQMPQRAAMLDDLHEDAVVIWDTSEDDESAQWGEMMTRAAIQRGCRGAVVDGGIRDTRQILETGFPVFNRYRTSSAMMGRFKMVGWQLPVKIGGVAIYPGDVIMGDIDGVVVIPRDMAYDVLLRAEEIARQEGDIKRWVEDGLSANEVLDRGGYF